MSRFPGSGMGFAWSFPRVSGDEPVERPRTEPERRFSPRERG